MERNPRAVESKAFICEGVKMKTTQTDQMNAASKSCPNLVYSVRRPVGQRNILVHTTSTSNAKRPTEIGYHDSNLLFASLLSPKKMKRDPDQASFRDK